MYYNYYFQPEQHHNTTSHPTQIALERILPLCESKTNKLITHIINNYDVVPRRRQLMYLRDIAQTCISTSIFVSITSEFSVDNVILCEKVAMACARESGKFADFQSQEVAKLCYECAEVCRAYVQSFS